MKNILKPHLLILSLALTNSLCAEPPKFSDGGFAIDLSEVVKDGGGYKIEAVELQHDFDKVIFSVIKNSQGGPLILNGLILEKNTKMEVSIAFSNGKAISYTFEKWLKITHPDLSAEGEISEVLIAAQSGFFENLQKEVKDLRLKEILEQAVKKTCTPTQ